MTLALSKVSPEDVLFGGKVQFLLDSRFHCHQWDKSSMLLCFLPGTDWCEDLGSFPFLK